MKPDPPVRYDGGMARSGSTVERKRTGAEKRKLTVYMPPELYRAHKALDAAVDKLYQPKGFANDRARVEHLFRRYEALVMPTAAAPAANRRTHRRVARAAAGPAG